MKNLTAILLDEADVKDASAVLNSLSDEANDAAMTAPIVIFRGQIVKNRFGTAAHAPVLGTPLAAAASQPDYRDALALALSAFGKPATTESSMARAAAFVCYLAGAVSGHGDNDLGAAIFAIVQPPETTRAGAA